MRPGIKSPSAATLALRQSCAKTTTCARRYELNRIAVPRLLWRLREWSALGHVQTTAEHPPASAVGGRDPTLTPLRHLLRPASAEQQV
jgi:hypothetical protein